MIPRRLFEILGSCENTATSRFPPTEVFNEGWMLRLLLDAVQTLDIRESPLRFHDGANWYSEALLASPFRPRARGDRLGEGFTNADAVVVHFAFDPSTKAGLRLSSNAKQFVVIEAKMFSNLSSGTTNARAYDQAVRNVACMAHAIAESGKRADDFERLAFFVIAPEPEKRKHRDTNLERCTEPGSLRTSLTQRILAYEAAARSEAPAFRQWEANHFLPLVERLVATGNLGVLSWETCITGVRKKDEGVGGELQGFYERCLAFERVTVAERREAV